MDLNSCFALKPSILDEGSCSISPQIWPQKPPPSSRSVSTISLGPLMTGLAISWLIYRAWQVLSISSKDLIDLLGIDHPPSPTLILLAVKGDALVFHSLPRLHKHSSHKYQVLLNGSLVGQMPSGVSTMIIHRLHPDRNYTIMLVGVNPKGFEASGRPVRFRTKSISSQDFFEENCQYRNNSSPGGDLVEMTPILSVCPPHLNLSDPINPDLIRRQNFSSGRSAQATSSKPGRIVPCTEACLASGHQDERETEKTLLQLTARLEQSQKKTEMREDRMRQEEKEQDAARAAIKLERDQIREAFREREEAVKFFKKEMRNLTRANSAAQAKRITQERLLSQRKMEYQKYVDSTARWDEQTRQLEAKHAKILIQIQEIRKYTEEESMRIRRKQPEKDVVNKLYEEQIRDRGRQIEEFRESEWAAGLFKTRVDEGAEGGKDKGVLVAASASAEDKAEDQDWERRLAGLQSRYQEALEQRNAAESLLERISQHCEILSIRQELLARIMAPDGTMMEIPPGMGGFVHPQQVVGHQRGSPVGSSLPPYHHHHRQQSTHSVVQHLGSNQPDHQIPPHPRSRGKISNSLCEPVSVSGGGNACFGPGSGPGSGPTRMGMQVLSSSQSRQDGRDWILDGSEGMTATSVGVAGRGGKEAGLGVGASNGSPDYVGNGGGGPVGSPTAMMWSSPCAADALLPSGLLADDFGVESGGLEIGELTPGLGGMGVGDGEMVMGCGVAEEDYGAVLVPGGGG